jgi:hypothetical protein
MTSPWGESWGESWAASWALPEGITSEDAVPWPVDELPFLAEHGSWTETLEPNMLNFEVEVGPAKRRRRTYLPSIRLQFQRIINSEELAIFLDFYENELQSGIRNFTAIDPRTKTTTEYQFMQDPTWRDVTSDGATTYWRLQFSLRKVNLPPAS